MPDYLVYTVLACAGFGVGNAMLKHGVASEFPVISLGTFVREWKHVLKTIAKNRLWLTGIACHVIGGAAYLQALSMGDISLLQPLVTLNAAITFVLGVGVLREQVTSLEGMGVGAVLVGTVLVSVTAAVGHGNRVSFPMLAALTGLVIVYCLGAGSMVAAHVRHVSPEVVLASMAGMLIGVGVVYSKVATVAVTLTRGYFSIVEPGAVFTLMASYWLWFVVLLNLAGFAVLQGAFAHGRVAIISPVATLGALLVPVISGPLVFYERVGTMRAIGILVIVLGTVVLSIKK